MIILLRSVFILVIVSMLAVTSWATLQCPLFAVPHAVATHPWFLATLLDAYWGFITFYAWVAYKETHGISRAAWLVAILLLGNIAMASYCLRQLFSVESNRSATEILTLRHPQISGLGLLLATAGIAVIGVAAWNGWHGTVS